MPFVHRPLDEATGEIRLLTFVKSPDDDPDQIACSIEHIPAGKDNEWGKFAAVSYVWGDETDQQHITLDGYRFQVRRNLYAALKRLRGILSSENTPARFWVDAICIKQDDLEERNHQVRRMQYIFGQAEVTYCFLPLTWTATLGTSVGPGMVEAATELDCDRAIQLVHMFYENSSDVKKLQFISDLRNGEIKIDSDGWSALQVFFTNPYWVRCWVLQEIALAKDPQIVVCDHLVSWNVIAAVTGLIREGKYPIETFMMQSVWSKNLHIWPYYYTISSIAEVRQQYQQGSRNASSWDLVDGLLKDPSRHVDVVRKLKCSDPRDRIYGILSLLDPGWASLLKVDYAKDVRQVYKDFIENGIFFSGGIEALPHYSTPISGMPTWVTDLGDINIMRPFRQECDAAKTFTTSRPLVHETLLRVCGLRLDKIDGITAAWPSRFLPRSHDRYTWPKVHEIPMEQTQTPPTTMAVEEVRKNLVLALTSGTPKDSTIKIVVPPLQWLEKTLSFNTIQGVAGTLDFLRRNGEFVLPNGSKLLDLVQTAPAEDGADFAYVTGEIDYQVSLRRLATTCNGRFALVPHYTTRGDVICALQGYKTLAVLRPVPERSTWKWIGNAFVPGLMNGEGVVGREDDSEEFIIE